MMAMVIVVSLRINEEFIQLTRGRGLKNHRYWLQQPKPQYEMQNANNRSSRPVVVEEESTECGCLLHGQQQTKIRNNSLQRLWFFSGPSGHRWWAPDKLLSLLWTTSHIMSHWIEELLCGKSRNHSSIDPFTISSVHQRGSINHLLLWLVVLARPSLWP